LHNTGQSAEALMSREARLTNDSLSGARAYRGDLAHPLVSKPGRSMQVLMLFGDPPKRKVLCSCGAIAEVDQSIASKKVSLGKIMECRACRNERIARERDELERHFSGQGDEEEEW